MLKRIKKVFFNYIPTVVKAEGLRKFPALYPALEIKPTSCTLMITNRCNLKCVMCKQWRECSDKEELNTEDWKRILMDLKKNGISNLHFTGGEPLLRKDLTELISYAAQSGFIVGLTTNGVLLEKDKLEAFVRAGLRSIAISMDAVSEDYDRIRGMPNLFEKVKETVSLVSGIRGQGTIDAYINFTLMKNNIKQFVKVKEIADDFRIPVHLCLLDKHSSIFDLKENKNNFWITEEDDFKDLEELINFLIEEKMKNPRSILLNFPGIDYIKSYFRDPIQRKIPCVSSQDRVIIDPYGNLLGGCMSMGDFGNLKDKSFKELREQEAYRKAKRNMFYKRCVGCSCGYFFNIRCLPGLTFSDIWQRGKHLVSGRCGR